MSCAPCYDRRIVMDGRDDTPRVFIERRHIAHRLLRARDWQDRPQLGELRCDWR